MVNIERQCFTSTQKARTLLYMSASKIKPDLGSRDWKQTTQSKYLAYSSQYRCSHPCSIFSDICNPCGLARNENSWALPQTSWIRNSGDGSVPCWGVCHGLRWRTMAHEPGRHSLSLNSDQNEPGGKIPTSWLLKQTCTMFSHR